MHSGHPIQVSNLINQFGDHVVHDGIDLEVHPGEILSIVGGSGSGKTVLLNSMIGLHKPTSGSVQLLDTPLWQAQQKDLARLRSRIGVVFQAGALFSAFTVNQNVAFPIQELHSVQRKLIDEIVQLKLYMVGLEATAGCKYPAQLSGGMRTRVALARALALDPELLFLDEPTSGLDPVSAEGFVKLISSLRDALDLTVVMVTHDLYTLISLSDRIAVLADRNVVALGTPEVVMQHPHPFIQAYFRTLREFPGVKK